jgi:hypothetical protein
MVVAAECYFSVYQVARRNFFFEKKKQKTFTNCGRQVAQSASVQR